MPVEKSKVDDILITRLPAIEISLAGLEAKQDLVVERVASLDSKIDGLTSSQNDLTKAVYEHMGVHLGHGTRLDLLESLELERKKDAKELNDRRRTTIRTVITAVVGSSVAAAVAYALKTWLGV